ncbi:uncharacterized protein BX664DRAFT_329519 [Halteromyces radiatus]|uniref:uncharacterized protein n=1 Tax=Halteromyces radiatus TaxID=101107 RepID=UPI0022200C3A|nr:uncharacterized protein BX664DRAFT_329519 [Halteromyces radiatus]KAI8093366.1 hypothetical protein BX664DRAFT_329519 [Halteromyces radiatus]
MKVYQAALATDHILFQLTDPDTMTIINLQLPLEVNIEWTFQVNPPTRRNILHRLWNRMELIYHGITWPIEKRRQYQQQQQDNQPKQSQEEKNPKKERNLERLVISRPLADRTNSNHDIKSDSLFKITNLRQNDLLVHSMEQNTNGMKRTFQLVQANDSLITSNQSKVYDTSLLHPRKRLCTIITNDYVKDNNISDYHRTDNINKMNHLPSMGVMIYELKTDNLKRTEMITTDRDVIQDEINHGKRKRVNQDDHQESTQQQVKLDIIKRARTAYKETRRHYSMKNKVSEATGDHHHHQLVFNIPILCSIVIFSFFFILFISYFQPFN